MAFLIVYVTIEVLHAGVVNTIVHNDEVDFYLRRQHAAEPVVEQV